MKDIEEAESLARILSSLTILLNSPNSGIKAKAQWITDMVLDELGKNFHKDGYTHWKTQLNARQQKTS